MENILPTHVNKRRRASLTKYTALSLLVYHIPVSTLYLAIYLGLAQYGYKEMTYAYAGIVGTNVIILFLIRIKNQITRPFIQAMLYTQFIASIFYMAFCFYMSQDLRYLILIACLLALIFVFIQSRLSISVISIAAVTADYLLTSYVSQRFLGQGVNFGKDVLAIIVFLPVSFFIAYMCSILQKQHHQIKKSRDKINETFKILETFNQRMMESLHYAEMIQRSLLPGIDRMKTESPESLIIWMPKDIVGGDIFYTCTYPGKTIVTLMDCTGHGVPGAFLTLIAYTEIRKIILDEQCYDPADILKRLNRAMKKVLHKHSDKQTNDGLDAAVIDVDHLTSTVRYAGAQIPVFVIDGGQLKVIKGDRHSIGYVSSDANFQFTNHTLNLKPGDCIYLKTDGYTDQLGGEKNLRFGTRRFKEMIQAIHTTSFSSQRQSFLQSLNDYKGDHEQIDDITVIGFRL